MMLRCIGAFLSLTDKDSEISSVAKTTGFKITNQPKCNSLAVINVFCHDVTCRNHRTNTATNSQRAKCQHTHSRPCLTVWLCKLTSTSVLICDLQPELYNRTKHKNTPHNKIVKKKNLIVYLKFIHYCLFNLRYIDTCLYVRSRA